MLKAVLFDMDGVLVDSEPEYQKLDMRLARELGFELTPEEQSLYVGVSTVEMWQSMQKKHGFAEDPLAVAQKETAQMARYYESGDLCPYHASVALLKSCAAAGLKVAVATSSEHKNAEWVVRRLGLADIVDAVVSSCMTERSKPAPDIFLLAMERLGVEGTECVVIEDADNGVTAARAAGAAKVIGIRHPIGRQSLNGADLVVDSLEGITVQALRDMLEQ